MDEKRKDDLKRIADHYGLDAQLNVATEELAELILAIARYRRFIGECDQEDERFLVECIAEEIADVEIMVYQIKYLLHAYLAVGHNIHYKVNRQLKRMENESEAANE